MPAQLAAALSGIGVHASLEEVVTCVCWQCLRGSDCYSSRLIKHWPLGRSHWYVRKLWGTPSNSLSLVIRQVDLFPRETQSQESTEQEISNVQGALLVEPESAAEEQETVEKPPAQMSEPVPVASKAVTSLVRVPFT